MLLVFIALLTVAVGMRNRFLALENFSVILLDASILMVVAIAQMTVMLTSGLICR